ncbi:MAG: hypothetical protein JST84_05050 [Acidobacteria bacterium]|nr:hypothetical protein [Acidobacteriota bacterium]
MNIIKQVEEKAEKLSVLNQTPDTCTLLIIPYEGMQSGRLINLVMQWVEEQGYFIQSRTTRQVIFQADGITFKLIFTTHERWVIDEYTARTPAEQVKQVAEQLKSKGYYLVQGRLLDKKAAVPVQSIQQVLQFAEM